MVSKRQSKFIKSLKIKKYRTIEKCFQVEGRKNIFEVIKSNYEIICLLGTERFFSETYIDRKKIPEVLETDAKHLEELGTFKTNNDCLAVVRMKEFDEGAFNKNSYFIALDEVSDPGNLGTIIRTMDWFGFNQLICSHNTADFFNPKVINATMGSFTRIKFMYTDLDAFIKRTKIPAYGADLYGTKLSEWRIKNPAIVVMGSESHGISSKVRNLLTERVNIPRVGGAESLNVAIATGIFCHHLRS